MKTILLILAAITLSSCTISVSPDGTRTFSLDKEASIKAIEVYSEK